MKLILMLIGLLFLSERIGKYLSIETFFQQKELDLKIAENPQETISILQPVVSGDPTLWECLAKDLQIKTNYKLEFLWLLDIDDEAAKIGCEKLRAESSRNIRLIELPPPPNGASPKMFKLIEGLKFAQGEIIAVLDDDTILPDQAFEKCVPFLELPQAGLAFGLPYYINFSNFWSSLVSCFVNGNSLFTYIPYTFFTEPFTINGMFYVIKKEILEKVGGFAGLEIEVCDDYSLAQRFIKHGYKLIQTPLRHGISTQVNESSHYFSLLNRWFIFPQISIMRSSTPKDLSIFYALVLIPNFFPFLVAIFPLIFPNIYALLFSLIYFSINAYILGKLNHKYLENATPKSKIIGIIISQIILPLQILISLLSPRRINWRGNIMEIGADGKFNFIQRRSS